MPDIELSEGREVVGEQDFTVPNNKWGHDITSYPRLTLVRVELIDGRGGSVWIQTASESHQLQQDGNWREFWCKWIKSGRDNHITGDARIHVTTYK